MTYAPGRSERFPNGMTLREGVEHMKNLMDKRRKAMTPAARKLAKQGRGNDTEVAHVARGEYVIPHALQTPEVMAAISRAAAVHNVPLDMLNVGNAANRVNPNTGAPEFGGVRDFDIPESLLPEGLAEWAPGNSRQGLTPEMKVEVDRIMNMPINIGPPSPQTDNSRFLPTDRVLDELAQRELPRTTPYPPGTQFMSSAPYSPTKPVGPFESFKYGATGFGAEAAHMFPKLFGISQEEADARMADRERVYEEGRQIAGRSGLDIPRATGDFLSTAGLGPLLKAAKPLRRLPDVAMGAIEGGIKGAFEPTTDAYSWEKLGNIAQGIAEGARDGFLDDVRGRRRAPRRR